MAKSKPQPTAPAEVLDAETPVDVELVRTDGTQVATFLKDLVKFFRGALVIESEATAILARAKSTKAPATSDEDADIQRSIREATALRKKAEDYWGIAQAIHALHRKVTAARARATTPAQEAADLWQRQHNTFVSEKERQRKAEEDRLRREEENRAAETRRLELQRLEDEALAAEASAEGLSAREQAFVDLVDQGVAQTNAALQAGFKDSKRGILLLEQPKILAALEAKRQARQLRDQAKATAAAPLNVETVEVKRDVQKVGTDRSTWSGEVVDLSAFLAAVLDPKLRLHYGIPTELLAVNQAELNVLAKALEQNLDRIPGLRARKNTRTI